LGFTQASNAFTLSGVKRLALTLDAARATRSRIAKEKALGDALAQIARDSGDAALATATRVAIGRALPVGDGRTVGAGYSLWLEVASSLPGYEPGELREGARAAGDLGDALATLAAKTPEAGERPGLSFDDVAELFAALASTGVRAEKRRLLSDAVAKASPVEVKYLAKVLLGGMRTGVEEGVLQGAIARAFSVPLDDVRRAAALVGDPALAAVLAREGRLAEARLEIGRPVASMLATPLETLAGEVDLVAYVVEPKIDGVRAQAHKRGGEVVLFARGMERMTTAFPEVARALLAAPGDVVLDGEIVARGEDVAEGWKPRPFQSLQPRLKKLAPDPSLLADAPVALVAFDLLADGRGSAVDLPWTERRARLEGFFATLPASPALVLHPYRDASSDTIDEAFKSARARGFEGLVLKRADSRYEAGRRGQAWLKVKRAYATLDVVVTAAELGHGKRAGVLSDYTFAVWDGTSAADGTPPAQPERGRDETPWRGQHEGARRLVNVGKAYTGLTDEEIRTMTERLTALTVEERGGLRLVRPEIVLEVAFDGVQPSTRHESGYALRFPRIARIRDDKTPEGADHLEAVEALFAAQVAEGHREEARAKPATKKGRAKKPPKENRQLELFGASPTPNREK
jgi:DNA ligase-1